MQFIPALHTYQGDLSAQWAWERIRIHVGNVDGYAYYQHPNLGTETGFVPDIVVLARGYGAIVVKIVREDLAALQLGDVNSPLLELDDFRISLEFRFNQERFLRNKVRVSMVLMFPQVMRIDYEQIFGTVPNPVVFTGWQDSNSDQLPPGNAPDISDEEWNLAKSVFQSASALNRGVTLVNETSNTLGGAIRLLERDIALLDDQQQKVAIQIPPGPQRIRGLAGTGKTVLLAMKAANIHSHFPDKNILFTFNTQSLYNQARSLITRFYRLNKQADPDWSRLHVRHGWGGSSKQGVYSDVVARQGARPLTFQAAKQIDGSIPLRACCKDALSRPIAPVYDYVLVDEAQDFPKEFFRMLYKLTNDMHAIYFAFDELQSLSNMEIPTAADLFGTDDTGRPLVDLDGEYPGPMDKDLILFKAYRSPHQVLMLAHALGLGIHSARGCVQMISNMATWHSIGYEVVEGPLQEGNTVVIRRPPENSPNRARQIYTGTEHLVTVSRFEARETELEAIAGWVEHDITSEAVKPEDIVVISLNSINAKKNMGHLQQLLLTKGILSVVPGLIDDADEFAEIGRVTLSTVYRAKGNEAPIVYIFSFDSLYDYVAEIEMRNRAFTCISRSKGWVRITGCGRKMASAEAEIQAILADIPDLRFQFPDVSRLERNLDAGETTRRRREVRTAQKSIKDLSALDVGALSEIDSEDLESLMEKLKRVREARGDDQ